MESRKIPAKQPFYGMAGDKNRVFTR